MEQKIRKRIDNSRETDGGFGSGQSPISEPFRRPQRRERIMIPTEVLMSVDRLGSEDKKVRIEAAYKLGEVGDTNAVYSLIEALKTDDAELRDEVIVALGKIASKNPEYDWKSALPEVSPILVKAFGSEDKQVKINARILVTQMVEDDVPQDLSKRIMVEGCAEPDLSRRVMEEKGADETTTHKISGNVVKYDPKTSHGNESSEASNTKEKHGSLSPEEQEKFNMQLLDACDSGDLEELQNAIDAGANIEIYDCELKSVSEIRPDIYHWNGLMIAAGNGHDEIINCLIENGVNVNGRNDDTETAIIIATQRGFAKVVQRLIEAGADVNETYYIYDKVETVLDSAEENGHKKIAELLIENGAKRYSGMLLDKSEEAKDSVDKLKGIIDDKLLEPIAELIKGVEMLDP